VLLSPKDLLVSGNEDVPDGYGAESVIPLGRVHRCVTDGGRGTRSGGRVGAEHGELRTDVRQVRAGVRLVGSPRTWAVPPRSAGRPHQYDHGFRRRPARRSPALPAHRPTTRPTRKQEPL